MFIGSWGIDDLLTFTCNTHDPATGAAVDADGNPTYRVYEDETGTPILTGSLAKLDDANTVGYYSEQITLSAANGFEFGKSYRARILATVGGIDGITERTFQIRSSVHVASIESSLISTDAQIAEAVRTELQATLFPKLQAYFRLLARKDAAVATDYATELGELNANGGSGAGSYDNATDGQEAIRDNMGTPQTGDTFARLGAPAGASVSADIAAIEAQTDDIGAAGAGLSAVPWNAAWDAEVQSEVADALAAYDPPTHAELVSEVNAVQSDIAGLNNLSAAQVNAEVLDVLNVDTFAEPGQEAPAATNTLVKKIGYLFKLARNKVTQDATTLKLFADDATTVDQKATVSDDGTTYTRGEIGTGP